MASTLGELQAQLKKVRELNEFAKFGGSPGVGEEAHGNYAFSGFAVVAEHAGMTLEEFAVQFREKGENQFFMEFYLLGIQQEIELLQNLVSLVESVPENVRNANASEMRDHKSQMDSAKGILSGLQQHIVGLVGQYDPANEAEMRDAFETIQRGMQQVSGSILGSLENLEKSRDAVTVLEDAAPRGLATIGEMLEWANGRVEYLEALHAAVQNRDVLNAYTQGQSNGVDLDQFAELYQHSGEIVATAAGIEAGKAQGQTKDLPD